MTKSLAPFFSLLLAVGILLLGNGLFGTLVPIRGDIDGFSNSMLGLVGAFYFAGFMAGSLLCPYGIRRVGHIRSFAVFAALASIAPILHALTVEPIIWLLLRAITGYCFAGLYMIIESWLNEQATNENRGSLLGIYMVVNFMAIMLGQLMLNIADPAGFELFAIVTILTSLALIPVALTTSVQPAPLTSIGIGFKELWKISPVGVMGCFVVGLTNSPFWTLGPVFAREAGLDIQGVSFFMSIAVLGGTLVQVPFGRLSDRVDRRWVLIAALLGAALASGYLASASANQMTGVFIGSFAFGSFALSLYGLCVAQANDHAAGHQFVAVSGGLLMVYSVGAVVGPVTISALMPFFGVGLVFGFPVAIYLPFIGFILYRMQVSAPVPDVDKEDYVVVAISRTGPAPLEFDRRSESDNPQDADAATPK